MLRMLRSAAVAAVSGLLLLRLCYVRFVAATAAAVLLQLSALWVRAAGAVAANTIAGVAILLLLRLHTVTSAATVELKRLCAHAAGVVLLLTAATSRD